MPMKSPIAKITQKGRKKKNQIAIQAVKKAGSVDIQTQKKKVQARIKSVKQRGRRH